MKAKVANLIVTLIILGNVIAGCKRNEDCSIICECRETEARRSSCFQTFVYIEKLLRCGKCDPQKCDCVSERTPLRICRNEKNVCAFEGETCQKCENNICEQCQAFSVCRECENEAFTAALNECREPSTNQTSSPKKTANVPSPVPANTNRGGTSGRVIGAVIGSVIGALVVIAVVILGAYWKWGNRTRVH